MIRGIRIGRVRDWLPVFARRRQTFEGDGRTRALEHGSGSRFGHSRDDRHNQSPSRADICRQIEINRAKWLDNARRSPVVSSGQLALTGRTLAAYAVVVGLAAAFYLAGSLQPDQTARVTAKSDIAAQPADESSEAANITLSKVVAP